MFNRTTPVYVVTNCVLRKHKFLVPLGDFQF